MTTQQKLHLIEKVLQVSQTKIANRLGVSFVTYNSWHSGKSTPRARAQTRIDELYKEVTGQKIVPENELQAKKQLLRRSAGQYKNVLKRIVQNPDIRDEFILKLTYHSNSIEGSTLTEPDTAAILFDNTALPHKSLTEQLEAKNHQTALLFLFDHLSANKKIDVDFILRLHAILMNGVRPDAGSYRDHGVRIVGVHLATANFLSIPRLMSEVFAATSNIKKDVITSIATVHSRFEQIHPFSDGNGRVGRLLMTAMLLRANWAPAVIRQENKRLYYTYLYKAQTTNDQSQLENFICDAITDGFNILHRAD